LGGADFRHVREIRLKFRRFVKPGTTPMAGQSKVRLFLVFWLFVLSTVAYLDRTNISIASVQLVREFGIDKIHLGWVFSAFLLGYAGFQVPAGWLAGRFGPRKTLGIGLLWWCVFSAATTYVSPVLGNVLLQLIVVRFVLGLGEALMYPSANQFIAFWIPQQERAKANGWVFAGVGAGAGFTPPIVTAIMLSYGWRASFWFSAAIGLAAALVWYVAARDRPEDHPGVSPGELAHIRAGIADRPKLPRAPIPWRRIFGSKDVWMLTLSYFSYGYIAFIFLSWFFIYLAEVRGLDLKKSALYSMMPFLSMTVCCLAGGVFSDWLSRVRSHYLGRCIFACVALLISGVFLVLGSEAKDTLIASIVLAGGAGALYLAQSSYWAVAADLGGPNTGVVSGVMNMGSQIAGAITASLTPAIAARFGWTMAFYVAACFAGIGAVAWLFVNPTRALTPENRPAVP
jgi:ACS family glucarate transporter-like MFS transporter